MTNTIRWALSLVLCALVSHAVQAAQVTIVDNDAGAPGYTETGGWSVSGSPGYNGGQYRFASVGGAHTATWTANILAADTYQVAVYYTSGTNRATAASYTIQTSTGPQTVTIDQTGGGNWTQLGLFSLAAGNATVTLNAQTSTGNAVVISDAVRFSQGGAPPPPAPSLLLTNTISPGVTHTRWQIDGPTIVNVVEFNLASPEYHLEMGWTKKSKNYNTVGREVMTTLMNRYDTATHDVVAGINCSFFDLGGPTDSIGGGTIASNSNLEGIHYTSNNNDEIWATLDSGDTFVTRVNGGLSGTTATLTWANAATTTVNNLNYDDTLDQVIVYTPVWGATTSSTTQAIEVAVDNVNYPLRSEKTVTGTITAVRTGAASVNSAIPANGLVIRGCATAGQTAVLANAVVGQQVSLRIDIGNATYNSASLMAHGAGHLVTNYNQATLSVWQQQGFWDELHPRTVIAADGTRHWFVTFDGRNAPTTIGADFQMMSDFLRHTLHVRDAINLDGGGSTTLVINGALANQPSGTPIPTMRAVPNAIMLVRETRTSTLPITNSFGPSGHGSQFVDKFGSNPAVAFSPTSPGGDGNALLVHETSGFETVTTGQDDDQNYSVQSHVWCDYRPEVSANGFERYGLFARDTGDSAFDATTHGGGNCYAMIYESNTGNVRGVKIVEGVITTLTPVQQITTDGWHLFRIETVANSVRFYLDGLPAGQVFDSTFPRGRAGLAYRESFSTNSNGLGGYFDNFSMEANGTVPVELAAFEAN